MSSSQLSSQLLTTSRRPRCHGILKDARLSGEGAVAGDKKKGARAGRPETGLNLGRRMPKIAPR